MVASSGSARRESVDTGFEVKFPRNLAGWKELRRQSIDEQRRALEDTDVATLTDEALTGLRHAIG